MQQFKILILTHLSVFATGVYIGKSLDADELEAYRSVSSSYSSWYDSTSSFVKKVVVGLGLLGGLRVVIFSVGFFTKSRQLKSD